MYFTAAQIVHPTGVPFLEQQEVWKSAATYVGPGFPMNSVRNLSHDEGNEPA
jgi:hypothetical protein